MPANLYYMEYGQDPENTIYQEDILDRFREKIIDDLSLKEGQCVITDIPESLLFPAMPDSFYAIMPHASEYRQDDQVPQLCEHFGIQVSAFNRLYAMDDSGVTGHLVSKSPNNLFIMKQKVVRCLVGWDLRHGKHQHHIDIASLVRAVRCDQPRFVQQMGANGPMAGHYCSMLNIYFAVDYYPRLIDEVR